MMTLVVLFMVFEAYQPAIGQDVLQIGDRRELFVDRYLIEEMSDVQLKLHPPTPREVVIVHDEPWEGNVCAYHTVFRDGDIYRMYYRGSHFDESDQRETHEQVYCYAESKDGIVWKKPELGLIEFNGSRQNNIVLKGVGAHNLAPFLDTNPDCSPEARYKALGSGEGGLYAFQSADGLRWTLMRQTPVITDGVFDSQNLAFWDSSLNRYVDYHRDFRDGIRDIKTCTSVNFLDWTKPEWITYGDAPVEHLYTNQIIPYARAPHVYIGFPMRHVFGRNPVGHDVHEVSDGVFMTSRDGRRFKRWVQAYIRPGLQRDRWINRNNMTAWGILETTHDTPGLPNELSIYVTEGYYTGDSTRLRRYTIRLDGFVSLHAADRSGDMTTYPLNINNTTNDPTESGSLADKSLYINYSTSAVGYVRFELLDASGHPMDPYTLDNCDEIYGDGVNRPVTWLGNPKIKQLGNEPIRLRIKLFDADVYSLQFKDFE